MTLFCPECGQPMIYEPATKMYLCQRCGLYASYDQLIKLINEKRPKKDNDMKKEYLKWWLERK